MDPRPHIKILPVHVSNKIAAGEVVERPASVLKELIENAVDAGSCQIDVDIAAGGRKLVAVSDNGWGMNRDDALLSIERHATDKISDVDDIERISTLGFRGEALAAIASVSRFRLITCYAGEVTGTEIVVTGGKLQDVRDKGCPQGTSVEVRDLFFNVPARRKFLRSYQTELSQIRAGFIVQALAHPAIGMNLKVDGREAYRLAGGAELEDRLRDLFGPDYQKNLIPVDYPKDPLDRTGEVFAHGFVSLPMISRSDRNEQYIFVNGRATGAPLLNYAISEGYHTLLPRDRHPSVFLFLELDPGLVDVNVHPTKKEVRFRHPGDVRDTVIEAIRQALASAKVGKIPASRLAPEAAEAAMSPGPAAAGDGTAADVQLKIENLPSTHAFRYPRMLTPAMAGIARGPAVGGINQRLAPPQAGSETRGRNEKENIESLIHREGNARHQDEERGQIANRKSQIANGKSPWAWCRVLGQIGSLYVVLETEDGFVLMDPHAAHERVLFERYMLAVLDGKVQTQNLLIPETVHLKPRDAMHVRKNLALFREMRFGISEFGGDAFVVDALPSYFAGAPAESLLVEIAHGLEQAGARRGTGRWREEAVIQAACKSAVKARDNLTLEEIEQLVVDLAGTEMPYTCPHGRPTLIFTSFKELNRKFGRE